jgi:hypothetical protein
MTAVEWLVNELEKYHYPTEAMIMYAKAMERQQIEDAANWNGFFDNPKPGTLTGEQYYQETYK